jgi:hypothetical protein
VEGSAHAARGLGRGLLVAAGLAQGLHIAVIVEAALGERLDVVANGRQPDLTLGIARAAQRLTREQRTPVTLQGAPSAPLDLSRCLGPCSGLVLRATAAAVAHEHTAGSVRAGFGCSVWHE